MNDIKRKATKSALWSAVGTWGNQITTFVVFIVLTRLLDPADFGLVAMGTVFITFMSVFAEQGLGQAIVQREHLEPEHLDTAFWTNMIMGSGLTFLGVLLSGVVANIYKEPALQPIVAALSITFLITAFSSTQQALLQRALNFRVLSLSQLIAAFIGGTIGIVMAVTGAGVYSLVAKTLVTGLVFVIILWYVSEWRPQFRFSKAHFRDLFGFGISMIGIRITTFLQMRLDDFLIGVFLGAEALGYYTVAYRLGRLTLDMFTGTMSNVSVSMFARLQNDFDRLCLALYKVSGIAGLITFPIFMGLAVLAPDLIVALSGEQWLPSAPVMRILSLAGFTISLQYFLAYLMIALGKPNRLFVLNLIVTFATSIAFILSVSFGIAYVALAYAVVHISFYTVYVLVAHRMLPFDLRRYLAAGWRFLIPTLFMGGIVYLFNSYLSTTALNIYIRLGLAIILGILVYTVTVFLFYRPIFMEMWGLMLSIIPLRLRKLPQAGTQL